MHANDRIKMKNISSRYLRTNRGDFFFCKNRTRKKNALAIHSAVRSAQPYTPGVQFFRQNCCRRDTRPRSSFEAAAGLAHPPIEPTLHAPSIHTKAEAGRATGDSLSRAGRSPRTALPCRPVSSPRRRRSRSAPTAPPETKARTCMRSWRRQKKEFFDERGKTKGERCLRYVNTCFNIGLWGALLVLVWWWGHAAAGAESVGTWLRDLFGVAAQKKKGSGEGTYFSVISWLVGPPVLRVRACCMFTRWGMRDLRQPVSPPDEVKPVHSGGDRSCGTQLGSIDRWVLRVCVCVG